MPKLTTILPGLGVQLPKTSLLATIARLPDDLGVYLRAVSALHPIVDDR